MDADAELISEQCTHIWLSLRSISTYEGFYVSKIMHSSSTKDAA